MRWQFLRFYIGLVLVLMMAAVGLFLLGQHEMKKKKVEWLTERSSVQLETIRELLLNFPGDEEARNRELYKISKTVLRPFPGPRHHRPDKGSRRPDKNSRIDKDSRVEKEPPRNEDAQIDREFYKSRDFHKEKGSSNDRESQRDRDFQRKESGDRGPDRGRPRPDRDFRGGGPPGPDRGGRSDFFPRIEKIEDLEITEAEAEKLESGDVIAHDDEHDMRIIIGLDADEALMLIRPSPLRNEEELRMVPHFMPIIVPLCILICIGTVLFFLIRPIERRLSALTRVTKEFGEGQLDRRVQVGRTGSIDALEESFNAMAARIENLVNSQKDLLRAVSHDIRTPLSRIFFALEEAENAKTPEDKNNHLKRIDKALLDLTEMINELLSFLRLDESEIKPDKRIIDINNLLEHTSDLASELGRDIDVESAIEADEVYGDPHYMKRVIENLLTNAIRHARERIFISTCVRDGFFNFMVDDDGPGVPEDEREKIFQPFYRLDKSRTSDLGGSGLGLAIVARIMQWQQGEVRISDSPLGGARFTLLLPPKND